MSIQEDDAQFKVRFDDKKHVRELLQSIRADAEADFDQLQEWRRTVHKTPELANQEVIFFLKKRFFFFFHFIFV